MVLHKFNSVSLTDIQANICTNHLSEDKKNVFFHWKYIKGGRISILVNLREIIAT